MASDNDCDCKVGWPVPDTAELPEAIRVIVRPGKDDWIGVAYAANVPRSDEIHTYVRVHPRSKGGEEELQAVLQNELDRCRIEPAVVYEEGEGKATAVANEIVSRFRISMRADALLPLRDAIAEAIQYTRTPSQVESEAAWRPIEVEAALAELRGIALHAEVLQLIQLTDEADHTQGFNGRTLSEAMQKVRESLPPPPQSKQEKLL